MYFVNCRLKVELVQEKTFFVNWHNPGLANIGEYQTTQFVYITVKFSYRMIFFSDFLYIRKLKYYDNDPIQSYDYVRQYSILNEYIVCISMKYEQMKFF